MGASGGGVFGVGDIYSSSPRWQLTANFFPMSIPDKFHRDLEKIIKKANPQNLEELQRLLDTLAGKPIPEPQPTDMTPEEQARELVWVYPPNPLPDAYSWGSKEEAAIYADMAWRAWLLAKGAKEWLRRNT